MVVLAFALALSYMVHFVSVLPAAGPVIIPDAKEPLPVGSGSSTPGLDESPPYGVGATS